MRNVYCSVKKSRALV